MSNDSTWGCEVNDLGRIVDLVENPRTADERYARLDLRVDSSDRGEGASMVVAFFRWVNELRVGLVSAEARIRELESLEMHREQPPTEQKQCDGRGTILVTRIQGRSACAHLIDCPGCDHPDCPNRKHRTGVRCEGCDREQRVGDEGWESRDALDWCPNCFAEENPDQPSIEVSEAAIRFAAANLRGYMEFAGEAAEGMRKQVQEAVDRGRESEHAAVRLERELAIAEAAGKAAEAERDSISESYDRMKVARTEALRERDQAIQKERKRWLAILDREIELDVHVNPDTPRHANSLRSFKSAALAALEEDDRG